MKRFIGYRPAPPEYYAGTGLANPPDEPQYEGCIFTDGTTVIRWCTAVNSTSVFKSFTDWVKVHYHPEYGTWLEWLDPEHPEP